jgi:carboxypeptidase Taq
MTAYATLERRFKRLGALREASGVLHWDSATVMPEGGAAGRAEQMAALDLVCHEILSDPANGELFADAEAAAGELSPWQSANLREMRREWRHATALDARLVEAFSRATKTCEMAWRQARPASDFAAVKEPLQAVLDLTRETAACKAAAFGTTAYDALLDSFEPGMTGARIDAVFADLAGFLPDFLQQVLERQRGAPAPLRPQGAFPLAAQEALARKLMRAVGFDFAHGRLDVSLHPFCGGVPDDVRITTRYDEADFTSALMGVLHETGHALYERGLPAEWRLQPVGAARGMAIHESQSLLIEMQACRSRPFIIFMVPLAREAFAGTGPAWEADNLQRLYNRVEPGCIRVDADEVTYPAHIILRYRLERALLSGDLTLDDLPAAWGEGMRELLGITPPDDRRGCLQDIHWYDGAWGYFPTYTLGAMTAAQFFAAATAAHAEIPQALGRGDFAPLVGWLREQVHAQASLSDGESLIERATGRPLDPEIFKAHLRVRYLDA